MLTPHEAAAAAVEAYLDDCWEQCNTYLRELEGMLQGRDTRPYLIANGFPKAILERAAREATAGSFADAKRLRERACTYVGEEKVAELLSEFNIVIATQPLTPYARRLARMTRRNALRGNMARAWELVERLRSLGFEDEALAISEEYRIGPPLVLVTEPSRGCKTFATAAPSYVAVCE